MAVVKSRRWVGRLAAVTIAASGLAALTLPAAPAEARVFVSVGVPGVWGYYPGPRYYPYPSYYAYRPYPYYYGYPYAYPAGVYFGRPFYHRWHPYWHGRWHARWHRRWR